MQFAGELLLNRYLLDLPIYYREVGFAVLTLNISIISDISEKSRTFLNNATEVLRTLYLSPCARWRVLGL
jgi:hypothetical protein